MKSDLASDRWTWTQTTGTEGIRKLPPPNDIVNWATVSSEDATSLAHMDTAGFGTATQLLTGEKYWVIFYRDPYLAPDDTAGDFGSISFAPPISMLQNHELAGYMAAEGVTLRPRDLL